MRLIKIAAVLRVIDTQTYEGAYDVWINPEKIVSVYPASSGWAIIIHMGGDRHHAVSHEEWARILPLLTDTPAQAPSDSLEFSRLMYDWYKAKDAVHGLENHSAEKLQIEKDAYFAIVDYIKRPSPALPQDVIDAYHRWEQDFQSGRYSNGMIAAIQDHLPERKRES